VRARYFLAGLIILGYLATLAVSSWHLAEWYSLSKGSLPGWLSFALAVTLEANAFILSLLSNSILRASRWAHFGALAALFLVWMGNLRSMFRGAPDLPLWEVAASSAFVPIGTYVMAKVMGELLFVPEKALEVVAVPLEAANPQAKEEEELLSTLSVPRTLRELQSLLPHRREQLPSLLARLERRGLVVAERGYWRAANGVVFANYGENTT